MTTSGSSWLKFLRLVLLLLGLVAAGLWQWSERSAAGERVRLTEEADARVAACEASSAATVARLAAGEAEAVARAFTSGINPQVLAGDRSAVDTAIGQLVQLSKVAFVHVVGADGNVLATSDRKVKETGTAGEVGDWARSVEHVTSRDSTTRGMVEVAVPVDGAGARVAVVVVGYQTDGKAAALPSAESEAESPEAATAPETTGEV